MKYSKEELREQCRWNTLCAFQHIPAILSAHNEVIKAVQDDPDVFGKDVMQRFKESLNKIVAVYKAAYPDSKKWIEVGRVICNAKKSKLASLNRSTSNADLVDSLLYTNAVEVVTPLEKRVTNIAQLLSSSSIIGDQTPLNNSNTGVWLQPSKVLHPNEEDKFYLFVQWKNISSTLFKYNNKWKQSPMQLRNIASRHPDVVSEADSIRLYHSEKAVPSWVGGSNSITYSVVDVTKYITESHQRETEYHSSTLVNNQTQDSLPSSTSDNAEAEKYKMV